MPFRAPVTIDRFAPALTAIRADMNAGASAAAPGCVLVLVTAVGGAGLLVYQFTWDPGWHTDPATLGALVAYAVTVWLVWRAGMWWATPAATAAEGSLRRLESEVLQPLVAGMRPGARYSARAEAPKRTLERSHLVRDAPFPSGNQIRWRAGDLAFEMFELESVVTSSGQDFSNTDRYFAGQMAWADLPERDDDFHVLVRSRHEFAHQVAGPGESAALDGFVVDEHYRVVSNWEPFARAVCTPQVQEHLLLLARQGLWVHASVADGRVWVGIETDQGTWFLGYPTFGFKLLRALDNAHLAALEQHLTIVEDVATALAAAVAAWNARAGS
ncbi:MAG: hypothetical protein ABI880_16895 [Acidobacteriota bacterium]